MKKLKSTRIFEGKCMCKMWIMRTKVVPVVVGPLGSIPLRLNNHLKTPEVCIPVEMIQRCALLV